MIFYLFFKMSLNSSQWDAYKEPGKMLRGEIANVVIEITVVATMVVVVVASRIPPSKLFASGRL